MIELKLVPETDRIIYRSAQPEGCDDFDAIRALGIQTVIDLNDDEIHRINEKFILEKRGIFSQWHPMSEVLPPKKNKLLWGNHFLSSPAWKQPILVHCKHGQDRTGYVVAAYRILHDGWSFKQAYKEAIEYGHKWWAYPHWIPSLLLLLVKKTA